MHLYVKVLKGSECEVAVSSGHKISEVKLLLQEQVSIPIEQQKLVYQGKALADDKSLSDYNITDGAKLFLLLKRPDGKTPSTSTSSTPAGTPAVAPALTPLFVERLTDPHTSDPMGFYKQLHQFLKRHFTEKDAIKVLAEFKREFDTSLSAMSLDDIERLAASRLHKTSGYFHQRIS